MRYKYKDYKSILILLLIIIANIYYANSVTNTGQLDNSVTWCCEKTISGAYCKNEPVEKCDNNFLKSPTSCQSTSFCQKGCCYDSDEGICMENTPESACKAQNGAWTKSPTCSPSDVPQCELGCCILGQQAAFVSLVRCKKLSAFYGLVSDFRRDVADELSCLALASGQDEGACVYEHEYQTTCKRTTRANCEGELIENSSNTGDQRKFYKGYLCTAPELKTNCEPLEKTTCVEGKDGVYFMDSCGNIANIYDSSMIYSKGRGDARVIEYWTKIKTKEESCGANGGNVDSKTCGNCDYLEGSICKEASRLNKPAYGDYICGDINCHKTSNGKDYKNGESWCYYDKGNSDDASVGSRHYRHYCLMGEEVVEACDDYRGEVCIENSINGFSQAGCGVNRWQDCIEQRTPSDCLNGDKRDCKWIPIGDPDDLKLLSEKGMKKVLSTEEAIGLLINVRNVQEKIPGRCVPKVAPGLAFWDESSDSHCNAASQTCVVKFEKPLIGDKKCVENCFCLEPATVVLANIVCSSIGDCGAKSNYLGVFTNKGYEIEIRDGKNEGEIGMPAKPGPLNTEGNRFPVNNDQRFNTGQGAATPLSQGNSIGHPAPAGTGRLIVEIIRKIKIR